MGGEMGLFGITASSEFGGSDMTYLDQCLVNEEMTRVSPSISASYGAQSNLCINNINQNGNDEQKSRFLPSLCSGQLCGALAMSEPGAGSDVIGSMKLTATRDGDDFLLTGSKFWITNGPDCDVVIVYARTDPTSKPAHGITAFIVEESFPGFQKGPKLDKLGWRGSNTGELIFDGCRVPKSNVLGEVNKGVYVLMSGLDLERLCLAVSPVGLMQACCDTAFEYAHQRRQFGTRIGEFQLIQAKMANMHATLSACRLIIVKFPCRIVVIIKIGNHFFFRSCLYSVARAADNGHVSSKDCASVIFYLADKCTKMALDTIQILGGNGYLNDYPAGRYLRDAKIYEIGAGTQEIRKLIIGRAINAEYKDR